MNSPQADSLGLQVKGVSHERRLACCIVLSIESAYLKKALFYEGTGSWQAWREETISGERPSWESFCKTQIGLTSDSLDGYLKCAEALNYRLSLNPRRGVKKLQRLMKRQPSLLTPTDRAWMIGKMVKLALTLGDKRSYLIKEYRQGLVRAGSEAATSPAEIAQAERERQQRVKACMLEEADRRDHHERLVRIALRGLRARREYENRALKGGQS